MANNAILHVASIDILAGRWLAATAIRLRKAEHMYEGPRQRHTEILHCFVDIPYNLDQCIAEPSPGHSSLAHTPAKDFWE